MSDQDPPLSGVLRSWKHEAPPAPRFNAEVWMRIEAARAAPQTVAAILGSRMGIPARHLRWALPVAACLTLAIAAVAGARVGARQTSRTVNVRMAAAYVRTIDPLQMSEYHQPQ
jgi:hypothetical protein